MVRRLACALLFASILLCSASTPAQNQAPRDRPPGSREGSGTIAGRIAVAGTTPTPVRRGRVVALPAVQGTAWQDPEFLESLRSIATSVPLSEGDAKTMELKLVRPTPR